ncbi:MAG: hypothetical protein J3Q66DRAFT_335635 [Benniella sp.]|nr:MAG: hypothetical protein J3Q66DRAFT_335635 [Benniella sp.]
MAAPRCAFWIIGMGFAIKLNSEPILCPSLPPSLVLLKVARWVCLSNTCACRSHSACSCSKIIFNVEFAPFC